MEIHDDTTTTTTTTNMQVEMWDWQGDDYSLQCNTGFEITQSLWNGYQNDSIFLDMLEEQTPIKECTDFSYVFTDIGDHINNELEECRDSSQVKRRRMLQFTADVNDPTTVIEQISSDFVNSKAGHDSSMGVGMENVQWQPQWNPGFVDDRRGFKSQGMNQSSERCIENSFNDSYMICSSNEMIDNVTLDDQSNISEFCIIPPEMEVDVVKETPASAPCKTFKGTKSYIKSPMKLTASVAYPFTLIKPCGVQGDLTLNDINQRIHAPLRSKSEHKKVEEPSINYPDSAFTGKPVIVKTKIHTEGGKGSITIMRTKG